MTLIELLVVITISLIFGTTAIRALNQFQLDSQFERASSNVKNVLDATQQYYESHCSSGLGTQPNVAMLVNEKHLVSPDLVINPFGDNFMPQINWGSGNSGSRIIVTSTFQSASLAERYGKRLGADRVVGATVFWDESPRIFSRGQGYQNLVNLHLYNPDRCR